MPPVSTTPNPVDNNGFLDEAATRKKNKHDKNRRFARDVAYGVQQPLPIRQRISLWNGQGACVNYGTNSVTRF